MLALQVIITQLQVLFPGYMCTLSNGSWKDRSHVGMLSHQVLLTAPKCCHPQCKADEDRQCGNL
ncbi:hypothetical protein E2C01_078936 [Portunus trituberculatus]|uniref:Uncharacterized protein n=1 Tax=Portunus trituberculatus TaxID=210409 RepID=A0A5B7IRJ2_PORTR|nr:hypothetical protein [Portunus trituberculatus]